MLGTVLVDHACPHCGHTSSAPLKGVYEGSVGFWCCEGCDSAFRVSIVLEPIQPSGHGHRAASPARFDRSCSANGEGDVEGEADRQRLLELCGESLYLQGRLQDLQSEIDEFSEQRCVAVDEK